MSPVASSARKLLSGCLIVALELSTTPAHAQWMVRATEENDTFCHCGDDHYTQGALITVEPLGAPGSSQRVWRYTIGQTMYTPRDLTADALIPNDRPYGGWLFLGVGKVTQSENRELIIEVLAGPTGKYSFAKDAQIWVHTRLGATIPRGWDNQLGSELGVNLRASVDQIQFARGLFDLTTKAEVELGNIFTRSAVSGQVRIGSLGSAPWAGPRPPSLEHAKLRPPKVGFSSLVRSIEIFGYTRVLGRWVGRNYFLDGNLFRDSHSVRRNQWVGELEGGVSVGLGAIALRYGVTYRTTEFEGGSGEGFGSLWLAIAGGTSRALEAR